MHKWDELRDILCCNSRLFVGVKDIEIREGEKKRSQEKRNLFKLILKKTHKLKKVSY